MYVYLMTLQPQSAQAQDEDSAQGHLRRQSRPKEDITVHDLSAVTTLKLLRLRAKTLRATFKRYWECMENIKPRKFGWDTSEGNGSAFDRQEKLLNYIEQHLPLIECYWYRIRSSKSVMKRWAKANRSGGDRHHTWAS